MAASLLRATGHSVPSPQGLVFQPSMGQTLSEPTEAEIEQLENSNTDLYHLLSDKSLLSECAVTQGKWLPLDVLDRHITVDIVKACTTLGNTICGEFEAEGIVKNAKKAFTILALSDCHRIMEDVLLKEGLSDDDLPLERTGKGRFLSSPKTGRQFQSFRNAGYAALDHLVLEQQWRVLAPVVAELETTTETCPTASGIHTLSGDYRLPLRQVEVLARTGSNSVYKCELHPAHYRSSNHKGNSIQVAVKEFAWKGVEDPTFQNEVSNLIDIRRFNNPHLIRHIAAFKIEREKPVCCIIFPFARGGDLQQYWGRFDGKGENDSERKRYHGLRTADLVKWALEQMRGVATGIRDLHGGYGEGTNVRHGDLKPANILLFEGDGDEGRLVIADLGIAKVHMSPTDARTQKGTGTNATTRAYEAPEANDEADRKNFPRSRAYDIWSLGCIFLEFAIWLLFDVAAVDNFANRRPRQWTGDDGGFYAIPTHGPPTVCEEVRHAITDLLSDKRCGEDTALGQLVRFIADEMLVTDVKGRCAANDLVKKLEEILELARGRGEEYLLKTVESTATPEMFLRKGSRSR